MRPRLTLGLPRDGRFLFWGMFAWEFGFGLYSLLLTIYIADLGATPFQIGILIGVQGLMRIAVTLPSGILAERFSRRSVIVWTTAATVPAVILHGVAQTWWQMFPGMILIIFGNLGTPSLASYIVDISSPVTRARTFAMIYAVGPAVATIISPTLGGFIAEETSIRALFFLSAIAYGASSLAFSLVSERKLAVEHGPKPSYREAVAIPAVRLVGLLKFGVVGTLAMGVTLLPNYLEEVHGLSISVIGRFGSLQATGSMLISLIIARVAWITGCKGIGIATMCVGAICGISLLTGNLWVLIPGFLMRGGFMSTWPLFSAVFGDITPDRLRSRAFALGDFLGGVGFGVAPFLAGALYAWRPAAPMLAAAIITPVLCLAAVLIERNVVFPAIRARSNERAAVYSPVSAGGETLAEGVA